MNDISLASIIIATLALVFSTISCAMFVGIKLSTHKIEWKPLEVADPYKDFEKFEDDNVEDFAAKAKELSQKGLERRKKKEEIIDPLDTIAESNNF